MHEHSTIYIVDETLREQQRLTLMLENTLGAPLYFAPIDLEAGPPAAENCHFELRFRRGVLAHASIGTSKNKELAGKSIGLLLSGKYEKKVYETGSWVISQPKDDPKLPYISFFLARAGKESAGLFGTGQRMQMVLTNISASPELGTRESRVELVPHQVFYLPDFSEEARVRQPREQVLQVVNRLGKEHIPLHTAFIGPNTVLNDGKDHGDGYSLRLRITNISRHEPISFKKDSRIIFEFDFPADGDMEEALGEAGNEDKIVFKFDGETINLSPGNEISDNPHWLLNQSHLLSKHIDPHGHWDIEVDLANFSTTSPAGLTLLKIKYENVPGYWDGVLHAVVEKTPLRVKTDKIPGKDSHSVRLDTGNRPAYFPGNLGIGTLEPAAKLDVHGVIRTWHKDHGSATWDNMELWSDGTKSYIQANGAEDGLSISAKAGNGNATKLELQINGGNVVIGSTANNTHLNVNGNVNIGSGKEIFFADNGQIRSLDNNHRIIFDRSNDVMELREYGKIVFSPGATSGQRTEKMTIGSNGKVGIGLAPTSAKLEVNGVIKAMNLQIGNTVISEAELNILKKLAGSSLKVRIKSSHGYVLDNYKGRVDDGDSDRTIQFQKDSGNEMHKMTLVID